jgi:hypothetical protein
VEIVWEGVSLGKTDSNGVQRIQNIPVGVFTLTLKKDGFKDLARKVEVEVGEKVLFFKLQPRITPVQASLPEVTPEPSRKDEITGQARKERPETPKTPEIVEEPAKNTKAAVTPNTNGALRVSEAHITAKEVGLLSFYLLAITLLGGGIYYVGRSSEVELFSSRSRVPSDLVAEDFKQREKILRVEPEVSVRKGLQLDV